METVSNELNIPKKQIKETNTKNRFILIAHRKFLQNLVKNKKLSNFRVYPGVIDEWPSTKELGNAWEQLYLVAYKKYPKKVIPLQKCKQEDVENELPLTYSQLLYYVQQTNHKNLWKSAYKKYAKDQKTTTEIPTNNEAESSNKKIPESITSSLLPYDKVLREIIIRMYGCLIIDSKLDKTNDTIDENSINSQFDLSSQNVNHYPLVVAIETTTHFYLLYSPVLENTLMDCVTYSPAILDKSHNKPLFIVYQLLNLMKSIHDRGLLLGDINLNDIYLTENLLLRVIPKLESNLIQYEDIESNEEAGESENPPSLTQQTSSNKPVTIQYSLKDYCSMWCQGQLTNFDYLTILNNFAGRRTDSADYHHIMPWVTDFTTRQGNWRDLTKSKYRLNKGDAQLDFTFQTINCNSMNATPHHVSDVLSEITYYVYMARKTPKSVLCKHVRPKFVAAEYPASIRRLQEWTPDECIPEFFSDPTVFKSCHEDLEDLQVPSWTSCPEDFIAKHREALESQHVSENLHHWIDLTFGYKLTGKPAIKAKNVCLTMVDEHKNLCQRGVVQLFTTHHPLRQFKNIWFAKIPPRINSLEIRKRMTRSSEDLSMDNFYASDNTLTGSTTSLTKMSSSPRTPSRLPHQTESIERSPSYHPSVTRTSNLIILPKNYNPLAQLKAVENMGSFITKTFYQKPTMGSSNEDQLKVPSKTVEFPLTSSFQSYLHDNYEKDQENSFTNMMFLETYEASLIKDSKMYHNLKQKRKQHQDSKRNFKQLIAENKVKELQMLGCLIVELFMARKLRSWLSSEHTFDERLEASQRLLKHDLNLLPTCVQYPVKLLFGMTLDDSQVITDKGLPTPNPQQLLQPILGNILIPFPEHYYRVLAAIKSLNQFDSASRMLSTYTFYDCDGKHCEKFEYLDKARVGIARRIAECKVKAFAALTDGLLEPHGHEQFNPIEILLPHIIDLIQEEDTSILSAWYLFDIIATAVGMENSRKFLLNPILELYDVKNDERLNFLNSNFDTSMRFTTSCSIFRSKKAVKLYHHSFLLKLIVRFGLRCFLENFISALIEAAGGYKDPESEYPHHIHDSTMQGELRHSPKDLKYSENDEEITLVSPSGSTASDDKTISIQKVPDVNEEMFLFDNDENKIPDDSEHVDTEHAIRKILDQFEMKSESSSIDLRLNHSSADELTEEDRMSDYPEVNEFMVGDERIKIYSSSPQRFFENSQNDPKSPTIPIPSSFRRGIQVNSIGCEIGSKKSTDSFDFLAKTPLEGPGKIGLDDKKDTLKKKEKVKLPRSTRISEMSSESLIWLSHRLGPVLTAKYLTKNLLKMLTLCYVSQEQLLPSTASNPSSMNIGWFTSVDGRVVGDEMSQNVLECLTSVVALFGEHFILLQYLPHISELIAMCKKKITMTLEGGLISSLQLLKYLIPCLSDNTISELLQDTLLKNIINPVIRLLGSSRFVMPSGFLARGVLARKILDVLYVLSIRVGTEVTREHLCVPPLQRFFLIFDKAYGIMDNLKEMHYEVDTSHHYAPDDCSKEAHLAAQASRLEATLTGGWKPNKNTSGEGREKGLEEIRDVFTPSLAHAAYLPFLKQLGEQVMMKTVKNINLVMNLCHEHDTPDYSTTEFEKKMESTKIQIHQKSRLHVDQMNSPNSFGSNVAIVGNRLDVQVDDDEMTSIDGTSNELIEMVAYKLENFNSNRQLKGNWLAYWHHEIGRSDKDHQFNLKQIKLQTYTGHSNSIRAILCLDNENSFLSASKDRTVKLWSLRSEGDGSKISSCQFTYTGHRKSVHSLAFLESMRLSVSCDSGVHLWDPFVGAQLNQIEGPRFAPVSIVRAYPGPSSLVLAGTADSTVKIIDARTFEYVMEWKLTTTPSGSVRCLAVSPNGNWIGVGLSSGWIVMLDGRSGIILSQWKTSEGELLQMLAPNDNELITSSLDHSISVWNASTGSLLYHLKSPPEPAHCLRMIRNELIVGTPANRIGAYNMMCQDHPHSFTRLRSEVFSKGVLTTFSLLPLNRLLLVGSDGGNITLIC